VLEDATLAVLAAAIGVGIGVALAVLVLPAVAFTETGRAAVPRPSVEIPWATVAILAAGAIAAILIEAAVRARGAGRASIAAELRAR
jgi:ABC-type antimicrobial peptide transport system permease subunit